MRRLWCFSSEATIPRSIVEHRSSSGSSTFTTWNLRASAASFSKYFLYSDQVVAAIVRNSPRARAGFRRLAASFCPACPPAPIIVWDSSMTLLPQLILLSDFRIHLSRRPLPAAGRDRENAPLLSSRAAAHRQSLYAGQSLRLPRSFLPQPHR